MADTETSWKSALSRALDERDQERKQVEALRAVLRSLISCGGTSPTIKAMAMNQLEVGSGDVWLASRA